MDKKEMLKSMMSLKSKLMATVSMLLVSAILLTNVSYAWFVLSTAPEVSGVSTTSGANGALEIALQSTDEQGNRAAITSGVGDSSALASQPITEANKSWGNVVDITRGYGLDSITLYPARLNVDAANNYKVNPLSYLSVPQYGTDGRIFELLNTEKTSYVESDGVGAYEDSVGYGVNVLGFQDTMEDTGAQTIYSYFERETVRAEAVEKIENYRSSLITHLTQKAIEDNSAGLFEIMVKLTTPWYADMYTWDQNDTDTVDSIIAELTKVAKESEDALRWALLAYAIADTERYTPNTDEMLELGEIYKNFRSMPITADQGQSVRSVADANGYTSIVQAVDALIIVQSKLLEASGYSEVGDRGRCLVDPAKTYMMQGKAPSADNAVQAHNALPYDIQNKVTTDHMYMVSSSESSGNLFSMMAYILGDYQADIVAYMSNSTGEIGTVGGDGYATCTINLCVTSGVGKSAIDTYDPETNVGTLQVVLDSAAQKATGQIPMSVTRSNVTAYGYSVDLAFRSSENGRLILQQEPISRVYDGTNNQAVQGSGSTMTFQIFGNMKPDQVARLLQSLYVVFMDTSTGQMYAVATADEIEIDLESVTATLALHEVDYEAMEETGTIRIKQETIEDNVLTTLVADEPKYITAVVFLNGDTVSGGDVSAQGEMSLIGSINMQFATDATLIAMQYDDYITRPAETTEPQTP